MLGFLQTKAMFLLCGSAEKLKEHLETNRILLNVWYPSLIKMMPEISPDLIRQLLKSLKFTFKVHVAFQFDVPRMYMKQKKRTVCCAQKGLLRMRCFRYDTVIALLNGRGIERYINLEDGTISTRLIEKARDLLERTRERSTKSMTWPNGYRRRKFLIEKTI